MLYRYFICVGRDKFMPRSTPCVFKGYPFRVKAYKVVNLVDFCIKGYQVFWRYIPLHNSNLLIFPLIIIIILHFIILTFHLTQDINIQISYSHTDHLASLHPP